jgi:anaerobic dimethyl sulfoxide reductase subunit B (iron-sulfur subunit)
MEDQGKVGKCNSCKDLRDAGKNPVCVDACLMRCIKFGDLEELKKEYGPELVTDLPILPNSKITYPSVLIKPKACSFDENFKEKEV